LKLISQKNNEFAGMLRATNFKELDNGYLLFTDGGEIQLPTNSEVLDLPETYSNKQKALAWYKTKLGSDETDINIAWWKFTGEIFYIDEAPASDFYKERIWSILKESGVEYSFKRDFMLYDSHKEGNSVKVVIMESDYDWDYICEYIDKLLYDHHIVIEITNGKEYHWFSYFMSDIGKSAMQDFYDTLETIIEAKTMEVIK
jgi:hypothetical protein